MTYKNYIIIRESDNFFPIKIDIGADLFSNKKRLCHYLNDLAKAFSLKEKFYLKANTKSFSYYILSFLSVNYVWQNFFSVKSFNLLDEDLFSQFKLFLDKHPYLNPGFNLKDSTFQQIKNQILIKDMLEVEPNSKSIGTGGYLTIMSGCATGKTNSGILTLIKNK